MPIRAVAQDDVIVPVEDEEKVVEASNVKRVAFSTYTPEEFQLQKRFWPLSEDTLWTKTWWRRITLGASVGINSTNNYVRNIINQPGFNGFLGYNLTPVHQFRVQGGLYNITLLGNRGKLTTLTGEVQYLANLTNMLYGFNPKRRFEVSTLLSLGARYNRHTLARSVSPFATAGFDLQANLGPNVSIFAQPYLGYIKTQRDVYSYGNVNNDDPARYNLYYGLNVGMAARLIDGRVIYSSMPDYCRAYFFEASTGWSTHTNPIANPIKTSLRYSGNVWNISVGRWLDPYFGARISFVSNEGYWNGDKNLTVKDAVSTRYKRVNFAGRAELMMNLTHMLSKSLLKQKDPAYEVDLSAGFQYGYTIAATYKHPEIKSGSFSRSAFYGFTAGAQALYRVAPGSYIFFEPRYQWNSYLKNPKAPLPQSDQYAQLNVGARVYTATVQERAQNDYAFVPHWWLGMNIGGVKFMDTQKIQDTGFGRLQPAIGFNLGYDYSPLASFRFQGEWQQLARTHEGMNTRYRKGDLRLMYMLPFTNLVRGYDSNYRFHTFIEAGPTMTMYLRQRSSPAADHDLWGDVMPIDRTGKVSLGGMAGILMSYDITKNWDVFVEANGQMNLIAPKSSGTYVPYGLRRFNDIQYGLSIGSRYHLMPLGEKFHELHLDVPEWQKGWFIEGDYGWAMPLKGLSAISGSGSSYRIGFGRWFVPFLGARVGIHAQQYYPFSTEANGTKSYTSQILADGEVDVLVNPLNILPKFRTEDRLLDLNLGLGAVYGHQANFKTPGTNRTMSIGMTTYAQALLRVAPGAQIYFEPRWTPINYGKGNVLPVQAPRYRHQTMTFSVGARILRPEDDNMKQQLLEPEYGNGISSVFNPHWWLGTQFGGTKELHTTKVLGDKRIGMQPTFSFNLGYDFTSLHTLRAQVEYQRMRSIEGHPDQVHKSNLAQLRLLYMLNLTNLWQGTRVAPRLSVFPELGLSASVSGSSLAPGAIAGAYVAYRLNNHWDAVSEAQFQLNASRSLIAEAPHTLYNHAQWNFSLGTRYHLEDHFLAKYSALTPSWDKGWFIEGAYGWAFPFSTGGSAMHASGSAYRIALGRWLAPFLGVRAVGYMQQYYNTADQKGSVTNYNSQVLAAGEVDLLTNPLNFTNKYLSEQDRKFDVNLGIGLLYGKQALGIKGAGRSAQLGFTALAQALYRVAPAAQIFVEPRFQVAHYGTNKFIPRSNAHDKGMFTLSVGARITRPEDDDVKAMLNEPEFGHGVLNVFEPHWWVGAQFGGTKELHITKSILSKNVGMQPTFGLNIGYDFTPLSTLRGQLDFQRLGSLSDDLTEVNRSTMTSMKLLYMLNLTNLWQGTRVNPRLSAYPEIGASLSVVDGTVAPGALAGALVAYRVSNSWDVTSEAQFQLNASRHLIPGARHSLYDNAQWNFTLGTRYHLEHKYIANNAPLIPSWDKGWFIEGNYGWAMPFMQKSRGLHNSGSAYRISLGRWLTPVLGLRASAYMQQHYNRVESSNYYAQVFGGAEFDLLTNPLNFGQGYLSKEDRKFDINLGLGAVLGKQALGLRTGRSPMFGFTALAQALYRVAPGAQVFVEPRFQTNSFSRKGVSGSLDMLTLSLGARITRPEDDGVKARLEDIELGHGILNVFEPHWWAQLSFGGTKGFHLSKYISESNPSFNPATGGSIGYDFSPLHTLRGQVEFEKFGVRSEDGSIGHERREDLRLLYMLNLTNLWQGTKGDPRLSAYPEVGVGMSFNSARFTPAVVGGALVAYRLSNHWDLTAESQIQYNARRNMVPGTGPHRHQNTKWGFQVGTRYNLKHAPLADVDMSIPAWMKGWFVEGSYGWAMPIMQNSRGLHNSGTAYRISFGHWLNRILGLRASAYMQQHYNRVQNSNYYSQVFGGAEIDLLANMMNLAKDYQSREDKKFDINLGLGVILGKQALGLRTGRSPMVGFTATAQALYRVAPAAQIFVEPRFQTSSFKKKGVSGSLNMMTFSLGARITRPVDDDVKAKLEDIEMGHGLLNDFKPHWWAQLSFGGTKGFHLSKYISESNPSFNPATGGSIGYDFSPLHTLRGQVEFEKFGVRSEDGSIVHERREDLRLLYMLNLTNLWQGTKGNPRLSAYPEAGVGVSFNTARFTPALVGGALVAYRITNHWDLTTESQIQYNVRRNMVPGTGPHRHQNTKWGFQIGTRYNF